MANGNSHGNSQLSRLKNTLLQVAERLESLEHHDHEGATSTNIASAATARTSSHEVARAIPTATPAGTAGSSCIGSIPGPSGTTRAVQPTANLRNSVSAAASAQEHRRLFNYKTSYANTKKKSKRPAPTCTLKFLCMAKCDSVKPPLTVKERTQLVNAGLGDCSIQFDLSQSTLQCHERIIQTFPKLGTVGYELLLYQRGKDCGFYHVAPPYTPKRLKDACGNSKIYIRPLQKDIELEEIAVEEEAQDSPIILCLKCGLPVAMMEMKNHHQNTCIVHESPQKKKQRTESWIDSNVDNNVDSSEVSVTEDNSTCVLQEHRPGASGEDIEGSLQALHGIFPGKSKDELKIPLESAGYNVERAVAQILNDDDDDSDNCLEVSCLGLTNEQNIPGAGCEKEASLASPEDVMAQFRSMTIRSGTQLIDFNRMHRSMLQQLMRLYKDPTMDIRKSPDLTFLGEMAADLGGPTKEFFHVAIEALVKMDPLYRMQLFTGEQGHYVPICNMDALSSGCFEMVGKLLAHSFLHGGTGLVGLAPAVVKYLTCGSVVEAQDLVTITDIPDVDIRSLLETKLTGENTVQTLDEAERDKIEELMVRHGFTDLPLNDANKDKAFQDIIFGEVIVTRTAALDSIFHGLNVIGVGSLLRVKPSISKFLFPTLEDVDVDITVMKSKFRLSPSAEKDTTEKTNAFDWFFQFLDECDKLTDEQTGKSLLHTMLVFITGCQALQSVDKFYIMFNSDDKVSLLHSDSCFNRVHLPLCHNTYQEFYDACLTSVKFGATGYGRF